MIYIIYPSDGTTEFLQKIILILQQNLDEDKVNIINVEPCLNSYKSSKEQVAAIPDGSFVIFMGHGTAVELYGGASTTFTKNSLFKLNEMEVFKNKELFLLSCHSEKLLKSSRKARNYASALGFGAMPTDMTEIEKSAKLRNQNIDLLTIEKYKEIIIEVVSQSILFSLQVDYSLERIYDHLRLLINRKASDLVISYENRVLADILFQMKQEMTYC